VEKEMSAMEGVKVACGQLTWGKSVPEEQVLAEIASAGYEGAPVVLFMDRTARDTVELFGRHGLKPAPGYLGMNFWKTEEHPQILERAKSGAAFSRDLGLAEMYVAANLTPERRALAGHVRPQDAPSPSEFKRLADLLNDIGRITLAEGVRACFHNHVGSAIETRQEIDTLFSLIDRKVVFQGVDLGHLAWAGDDAGQFCKDYRDSIKTLHVKDIDPSVRAEGVARNWDYRAFSDHGIFAELGEGLVDFVGIFEALSKAGFTGWIVVETDVTRKASALESARISRNYLASIGV
jgi:inosose dehydratase